MIRAKSIYCTIRIFRKRILIDSLSFRNETFNEISGINPLQFDIVDNLNKSRKSSHSPDIRHNHIELTTAMLENGWKVGGE